MWSLSLQVAYHVIPEGSEDLELEVSLGRHDRRKGQRDERGGEGRGGREAYGEGIGEGLFYGTF